MTRINDALKRASTGTLAVPSGEHDPSGLAIPFFSPGQAPVATPWAVGESAEPVDDGARMARREGPALTPFAHADLDVPIRWPVNEDREKLVVSRAAAPLARHEYNKLAAALHQAQLERGIKVVMVTSAAEGEGKTLTAVNLALTFSESYERQVLLIDADLRQPGVHELLSLPNTRGLSDLLETQQPLPLIRASAHLTVLTAGSGGDEPMKTLTSQDMHAFIQAARSRFDWVFVDTAPVNLLPDAKLLASMADATLLVAAANRTRYDESQGAVEALGPGRVFGVVLNRVPKTALHYGGHEYRR